MQHIDMVKKDILKKGLMGGGDIHFLVKRDILKFILPKYKD